MTTHQPDKSGAAKPEDSGYDGARRVRSVNATKGDTAKEARVKAALKANIAKRKAQAKLRGEDDDKDGTGQ